MIGLCLGHVDPSQAELEQGMTGVLFRLTSSRTPDDVLIDPSSTTAANIALGGTPVIFGSASCAYHSSAK